MNKHIVFAAISILFLSCSKTPEQQASVRFEKGLENLVKFNFERAEKDFKKVAELIPQSPRGLFGIGLIFETRLQYYDALHLYMTVADGDPLFIPAREGVYRVMSRLGHPQKALKAAIEIHSLNPDSAAATFLFAEALVNANQPRRARRELRAIPEPKNMTAAIHFLIARSYLLEHFVDSAAVEAESGFSEDDRSALSYSSAADYFEAAGLPDSANMFSRLAVESSLGDYQQVMTHFYRALRIKYIFEARSAISDLDSRGAGETIKSGMEIFYHLARGSGPYAFAASTAYHFTVPDCLSSAYYEIITRGPLGDEMSADQEARLIETIMIRENYNLKFQSFMVHQVWLRLSELQMRLMVLDRLKSFPPYLVSARETQLAKAHLLYSTGQSKECEELVESLLKYHPDQADWLTSIADIYGALDSRNVDQARVYYEEALDLDQWYLSAFEKMVRMYVSYKRYGDAVKTFERYDHFEQRFPEMAALKAECLIRTDKIEPGLDLLQQKIHHLRGNLAYFSRIVTYLDRLNRLDEVTRVVELMLQLNPENSDALMIAADYRLDMEQYDRVLEVSERALEIEPSLLRATVRIAEAEFGLGQTDKAIQDLQQLLKKHLSNHDAKYALSKMMAAEGIDLSRASNLARASISGSGSGYRQWSNLCDIYYKMGRFDLARGEANKFSRLHPNRPEPFYWKGITMHQEGIAEAEDNLRKAIDQGLRGRLLERAQETLEKL